jgi:hypothetical protein
MAAGGDLIWVGTDGAPHARAVLCAALPHRLGLPGATVVLQVQDIEPWQPVPGPATREQGAAMVAGARRLGARLGSLGAPQGFARFSVGAKAGFPLEDSGARARALGSACVAGEAKASAAAALALIGLGEGLTPSGDDFAGAAFFARILLARAGAGDIALWRAAADTVLRAAPALTHPISVALLGDLLAGSAPAALHDLAHDLATQAAPVIVDDTARRLVGIGHTSGWNMLAGFVAGCAGLSG